MMNSAKELSEFAEEMPQKMKDEWSSFKDEVLEETERLEKNSIKTNLDKEKNFDQRQTRENLIQTQIDNLRSKVIEINKKIEEKN